LYDHEVVYADMGGTFATGLVILVAGLLVLTILFEYARRWREGRRQLAVQWRMAQEIATEKQLTPQSWNILSSFIRKYSPKAPLRVLTVRQHFDSCVEKDIAHVESKRSRELLEKRAQAIYDIRVQLGLDYTAFGQRINSTREMHRGQPVWIMHKQTTDSTWYRMAVTSMDEAFFQLTPHEPAAPPKMRENETIRCQMWRENDARYDFEARIERIIEHPPLWELKHTSTFNRIQARAYFRIHFDQNTNVAILNAPVDGDMSDAALRQPILRIRGRITSLSGGGFAVIVTQPVPMQVLLRITLELGPENGPLEVVGRLVGSNPMAAGRYLLRAAFVNITEETREVITKYIFKTQQPIRQVKTDTFVDLE
jgi:c-di-GMP-binding flagellar brake protein YcgR